MGVNIQQFSKSLQNKTDWISSILNSDPHVHTNTDTHTHAYTLTQTKHTHVHIDAYTICKDTMIMNNSLTT